MEKVNDEVELEINKTLDLLHQFNQTNLPDEKLKKLVLLIGMTGTGKSTLASYLAGESHLTVVEENGEYRVRGPRIGEKMIASETLFPDLVPIDTHKEYYLVDCPGFGDTRSPSHDIAATVFIKSLLERAEQVKFGIVMVWDDFMGKGDRKRLSTLIEHMNTFFNPANALKDNFGVIVNQVPSGKKKEFIINSLDSTYPKPRDEFINIVTNNKGEKMVFFHIANQTGNMNDIDFLKEDKKIIFNMFEANLAYFNPKSHSFGSPIHADTKIYINKLYNRVYRDMNRVINNNITNQLEEKLGNDGEEKTHFYDLVTNIAGLKASVEPRSNLLAQLEIYDSAVAKDLKNQERILALLKQLAPFGEETTLDKEVKTSVESFKTTIEKMLRTKANKMYETISKEMAKCMDDFLASLKISAHPPASYEEMEELLFLEIDKLTNMTNIFKATQVTTFPLLQMLDSTKYKDSDKCNNRSESLDKVQQTSYVTVENSGKSIIMVQKFVQEVEEKVIKWIENAVWTKFVENVDVRVFAVNTDLTNKFMKEVANIEEQDARKKILEKYDKDLENLLTSLLTFDQFHQKITSFVKNANLTDLYDDFKRLQSKKNSQIDKHVNEPRDWGRNLNNVRTYVKNSAPAQSSFINAAAKWVKSQIFPLLPGSSGGSHDVGYQSFHLGDVNPTLMLMDLVVRQFTGAKHRAGSPTVPAMDDLVVQAHTLNIIDECEAYQQHEGHVDFVGLQTVLHKRLSQLDDAENVGAIKDEFMKLTNGPQSA